MNLSRGQPCSLIYVPTLVWRDSRIQGRHWLLLFADFIEDILQKYLEIPNKEHKIVNINGDHPPEDSEPINYALLKTQLVKKAKDSVTSFAYSFLSSLPDTNGPLITYQVSLETPESGNRYRVDIKPVTQALEFFYRLMHGPDTPKVIVDCLYNLASQFESFEKASSASVEHVHMENYFDSNSVTFLKTLFGIQQYEILSNGKKENTVIWLKEVMNDLNNNISTFQLFILVAFTCNIPLSSNNEKSDYSSWKFIGNSIVNIWTKSRIELKNPTSSMVFSRSPNIVSSVPINVGTFPVWSAYDYLDSHGFHRRMYFDNPYIELFICTYNALVVNFAKFDELRTILLTKIRTILTKPRVHNAVFFSKFSTEDINVYNLEGNINPKPNPDEILTEIEFYHFWKNELSVEMSDMNRHVTNLNSYISSLKIMARSIKTILYNLAKISVAGRPDTINMSKALSPADLEKRWIIFISQTPSSFLLPNVQPVTTKKPGSAFNKSRPIRKEKGPPGRTPDGDISGSDEDQDFNTSRDIPNDNDENYYDTGDNTEERQTVYEAFASNMPFVAPKKISSQRNRPKESRQTHCSVSQYRYPTLGGDITKTYDQTLILKTSLISDEYFDHSTKTDFYDKDLSTTSVPSKEKSSREDESKNFTEAEKRIMYESEDVVMFGCEASWLQQGSHESHKCHKCLLNVWDNERDKKMEHNLKIQERSQEVNAKRWAKEMRESVIKRTKDYYIRLNHPYFYSKDMSHYSSPSSTSDGTNNANSSKFSNKQKSECTFGNSIVESFPPFMDISYIEKLCTILDSSSNEIEGFDKQLKSLFLSESFEQEIVLHIIKSRLTDSETYESGLIMNEELIKSIVNTKSIIESVSKSESGAEDLLLQLFRKHDLFCRQSSASFYLASCQLKKLSERLEREKCNFVKTIAPAANLTSSINTAPNLTNSNTTTSVIGKITTMVTQKSRLDESFNFSDEHYYPFFSFYELTSLTNPSPTYLSSRLTLSFLTENYHSRLHPVPLYDALLCYINQTNFLQLSSPTVEILKNLEPMRMSFTCHNETYPNWKHGFHYPPILRSTNLERIRDFLGEEYSESFDVITKEMYIEETKQSPDFTEYISDVRYALMDIEIEKYGYQWDIRCTDSTKLKRFLELGDLTFKDITEENGTYNNSKYGANAKNSELMDNDFNVEDNEEAKPYQGYSVYNTFYDTISHVGDYIPDDLKQVYRASMGWGEQTVLTNSQNDNTLLSSSSVDISSSSLSTSGIGATHRANKTNYIVANEDEISRLSEEVEPISENPSHGLLPQQTENVPYYDIFHSQRSVEYSDEDNLQDLISPQIRQEDGKREQLSQEYALLDKIHQDITNFLNGKYAIENKTKWNTVKNDPLLFVKKVAYLLNLQDIQFLNTGKNAMKAILATIIDKSLYQKRRQSLTHIFSKFSKIEIKPGELLESSIIGIYFKHPYLLYRNSCDYIFRNSKTCIAVKGPLVDFSTTTDMGAPHMNIQHADSPKNIPESLLDPQFLMLKLTVTLDKTMKTEDNQRWRLISRHEKKINTLITSLRTVKSCDFPPMLPTNDSSHEENVRNQPKKKLVPTPKQIVSYPPIMFGNYSYVNETSKTLLLMVSTSGLESTQLSGDNTSSDPGVSTKKPDTLDFICGMYYKC